MKWVNFEKKKSIRKKIRIGKYLSSHHAPQGKQIFFIHTVWGLNLFYMSVKELGNSRRL